MLNWIKDKFFDNFKSFIGILTVVGWISLILSCVFCDLNNSFYAILFLLICVFSFLIGMFFCIFFDYIWDEDYSKYRMQQNLKKILDNLKEKKYEEENIKYD